MANPTMAQILEDTRRLVGTKLAAAKTQKAAEIVGQDPASMPGAEHDSKTPEETKKPDAETRDGTMVPTSGLTTEGAGDDSKITHGGDLGAEESALEPTKKPAVTSDANAKTASADLANEILSLVRGVQKQAAAPAAAAPAKKEEPAATKAAAPAAPTKKEEPVASDKSAGAAVLNMPLTTDIMAKLAALMLNTDEGAALAEKELEKQAGAEAAVETMQFLIQQSELAEKQAAYEQGLRDADAAIDQQIFIAGVRAAQAQMAKAGQAMPPELAGAGGGEGADVAAMMGGAGGAPEMGGDMGGGEMDPAMAGGEGGEGDEEFSMEDLQAALEALVAEGTLQPEEAQQLIASLTGEGGGEAAPAEEGDAGAGDAGAAAPAEGGDAGGEAAPAEEGEKEASATNLLVAIRQLRAARAK